MKITKKYLLGLIAEETKRSLQEMYMEDEDWDGPSSGNQAYDREASEESDTKHEIAQLRSELDQIKRAMEGLATALELLQGP
jgi:lipopolysaccharide biosynthesis regulator YciM